MTCVSSTGYRPSERPGGEAVDRVVSCDLVFDVEEPADIALHIVAASGWVVRAEGLAVMTGGKALPMPVELAAPHHGRLHLVCAPRGVLSLGRNWPPRLPRSANRPMPSAVTRLVCLASSS